MEMRRYYSISLKTLLLVVLAAAFITYTELATADQEIKTIETRPGITMRILLNAPDHPPKGVLIMFPGGWGANHFQDKDGKILLGENFLVRSSPEFVKRGVAIAIVDVPSDQANGMSDVFRNSPEHAQDIGKTIEFLVSQGLQPVYLVGTSRGTLSAAYLGAVLKDDRIKGIVLTSSLAGPRFLGVLPLKKITYSVLIVHHRYDECKDTQYNEARQLKSWISRSPRVDFVEVRGGSHPQSDPCEALSYHGFLGMEDQVVQVITDWLSGKTLPSKIGQ